MKINDNYIIITQNNTIFFTTPIEPSLKEKIAAGVTDNNLGLRGSVHVNWL